MSIWRSLWRIGNIKVWDGSQRVPAPFRILLTGVLLGAIEGSVVGSIHGGWRGACWGCLFGGVLGRVVAELAWRVRHRLGATWLAITLGGLVEFLGALVIGWLAKNLAPGDFDVVLFIMLIIWLPHLVGIGVCLVLLKRTCPELVQRENKATFAGVIVGFVVAFVAGAVVAAIKDANLLGALVIASSAGVTGGLTLGVAFACLSSLLRRALAPRRMRIQFDPYTQFRP